MIIVIHDYLAAVLLANFPSTSTMTTDLLTLIVSPWISDVSSKCVTIRFSVNWGFSVKIEVQLLYRSEEKPRFLGYFPIPNDDLHEGYYDDIIPTEVHEGYIVKGMVNLPDPTEEFMLQIAAHGAYMVEIALHSVSAVNTQCTEESKWHYRCHDDVIKWKHFPRYWPFVRGIHRSSVNSPHKGQWRGALMFSLICAWINGWVNND